MTYSHLYFYGLLSLFSLLACQKINTSWTPSEAKTKFRLNAVTCPDDSVCYTAGGVKFSDDITFKSNDGGKTWDTCASQMSGKCFYDIEFRDAQHGLVGGTDGRLYMTEDGGKNWRTMQMGIWRTLYAFDYVNDSTILAVGGDGYNAGIIWRYTPTSGWSFIDTPAFQVRAVESVGNGVVYAGGYATIIKSQDSGKTWTTTSAKNELFCALSFLNEKVGYAVGRTGTIIKTIDGGETWQTLRSGNSPFHTAMIFNDVAFFSENVGYVVGDKGVVMKTTDGGKTWKSLGKYGKADLRAIHLWSENSGILVGENGAILHFGG